MKEQRTDLKSFDKEMLSKLMDLRDQMYCGEGIISFSFMNYLTSSIS